MPNPSQQRALPGKPFRYAVAGVAVVGAGMIAVTPATVPLPDVQVPNIQLTSSGADIDIDFVRHADTTPPDATDLIAGNGLPGAPVSGLPGSPALPVGQSDGWDQAIASANQLATQVGTPTGTLSDGTPVQVGGVEAIYGGYEQRMIETAEPFLTNEGDTYTSYTDVGGMYVSDPPLGAISPDFTFLNGFDEIGGGIYADAAPSTPGALLSELEGLLWVFGVEFAPLLGSNDWNGVQFSESFTSDVNQIYSAAEEAVNQGTAVVSATGAVTDVVYSGEGAITGWTALNVLNPDLAILLPLAFQAIASGEFLPPAGMIDITGNPTDGWTLVSWDGVSIPSDPGLLTELFVDTRNLVVAPQTAAWNIFESVFGGAGTPPGTAVTSFTSIWDTFVLNIDNVGTAIYQYPISVFNDIVSEVQNFFSDVAGGESVTAAFDAAFIGLT